MNIKYILPILCASFLASAQDSVLVWSDEFDYVGPPDSAKWGYEIGYVRNNEAQYYSDRSENVRVENGVLILEARADNWNGHTITSGSVTTKHKSSWMYGRVDVRARYHTIRGTWPAIWLLSESEPYGYWPSSGEIDILENVGFQPDYAHGTVHTDAYNHVDGTQLGSYMVIPNLSMTWNIYSLVWSPDSIHIQANGQTYMRFGRHGTWSEWPFDHYFYLILNMAIGGSWGGQQGIDTAAFPVRMEVDYARVYKLTHGVGPYTITTTAVPVDSTPGSFVLNPSTPTYAPLSTVIVEAVPKSGWRFNRWAHGSYRNPDTLLVDHNMHLEALFSSSERIEPIHFNDGLGKWYFWTNQGSSITTNGGQACITVPTAGEDWQTQLDYGDIRFSSGEKYDLRLRANASVTNRPITVVLRQHQSPYTPVSTSLNLQLGTAMQTYTHQFTVQANENSGRLELDFGQHASQVCLAEVSLRLVEPNGTVDPPSTDNLVSNPGFESGTANWSDWGNSLVVTTNAHSGTQALQVGTAAGGSGNTITGILANKEYTLSAWGKLSQTSTAGAHIGVKGEDASGVPFEYSLIFTESAYQQKSLSFTTPATLSWLQVFVWKNADSEYFYADDIALIEVVPLQNQAPVVSAGSAQTISLSSTATLSGSASDDNLPSNTLSTTWSKLSGPGTVTFGNASQLSTTASFSAQGIYVLRLTATDGLLSTTSDVTITVQEGPTLAHHLPIASGLNSWSGVFSGTQWELHSPVHGEVRIVLYSVGGLTQVLYRGNISEGVLRLNPSGLSAGIYFLSVRTVDGRELFRKNLAFPLLQ